MAIKDSHFLKEYRNQIKDILKQKHPNWDDKFLKENIDKILERELRNPPAILENSYTHEARESNLVSVLDWVIETKPIIAANGTFFKQHKDAINPNALMVDEFLVTRKKVKKEMFAIEDESSREYKMKDLSQGNYKKLANSLT